MILLMLTIFIQNVDDAIVSALHASDTIQLSLRHSMYLFFYHVHMKEIDEVTKVALLE